MGDAKRFFLCLLRQDFQLISRVNCQPSWVGTGKEAKCNLGTDWAVLVQTHWEIYGYLAFKMHCNQEMLFRVTRELGSKYYTRIS